MFSQDWESLFQVQNIHGTKARDQSFRCLCRDNQRSVQLLGVCKQEKETVSEDRSSKRVRWKDNERSLQQLCG